MKATVNFAATAATPRSLISPARSRSGAEKQHRFDKTANTTTTWLTPRAWVRALGPFDLDPCTPTAMPWKTATRMLTEEDDGLATPWPKSDFVFHNPPYGRGQERWMKKAAEHGNGISLVLNRADTQWFREWVLTHSATTALLFVEGRVKFCTADGKPSRLTCPVPAIFVAYGARSREPASSQCVRRNRRCLLRGGAYAKSPIGEVVARLREASEACWGTSE